MMMECTHRTRVDKFVVLVKEFTRYLILLLGIVVVDEKNGSKFRTKSWVLAILGCCTAGASGTTEGNGAVRFGRMGWTHDYNPVI